MAAAGPNQAILRVCMVNGVDISQSLRQMAVSASIFSPFHSIRLAITDTSKVSDALYESGVPIRCVYTGGDGKVIREFEFLSHSNKGGQKGENPRVGGVEIVGASKEWFKMASEKHSGAYQNQPGTSICQKIWKDCSDKSLSVSASKGVLGQHEPYHIRNESVGNALHNTRGLLTHAQHNSGMYTLFLDNAGEAHLKPFEQLMSEADGQKFTMRPMNGAMDGGAAFNIFSMKKMSDNSKHVKSQNQVGTKPDEGKNWKDHTYKPPTPQGQKIREMNTPGKTASQYQTQKPAATNYNRTWDANQGDDPGGQGLDAKSGERRMKDMAQQGLVRVNVPIAGGLMTTVGKGINLSIPTESGMQNSTTSPDGGRGLITASTDYIFMGDRGMTGYTAIDSSSGGRQA